MRVPIRGFYGIADADAAPGGDVEGLAALLLNAGVRVLQLRMKYRPDDEVEVAARAVLARCVQAGAALVLNDRVELAARIGGVGAHLGQDDMLPSRARSLLGHGVLLGLSTHDAAQVATAALLPLDYIGFGPIFGAQTKHLSSADPRTPDPAVGLDELAAAVRASAHPMVAIGGISEGRLTAVLETGVDAVAAIGAVTAAQDPAQAARRWVAACAR